MEVDRSPLLYNYLKRYQEDPKSRVFAPLAEAYRKSGLIDEAIEIAREGVARHPHFVGGRVALARALFDKKDYEQVLEELNPVVRDNPDNIMAQRLVAECNLFLGRAAEALAAYKMLLYFSPSDPELAKMVLELEEKAYRNGTLVLKAGMAGDFEIRPAESAIDDDPELKRRRWRESIRMMQGWLQQIEKYRQQH